MTNHGLGIAPNQIHPLMFADWLIESSRLDFRLEVRLYQRPQTAGSSFLPPLLRRGIVWKPNYGLTPNFFRKVIMGHQSV
ncbi:MAG TPA: hypothetical protein VFD30_19265, partial [Terriglobia bacterium]|nr:hypothetical protein [Terriglobia bacterium]